MLMIPGPSDVLPEALEARFARHVRAAKAVRSAALAVGFEQFAEREEVASPTITSLVPPPGIDEAALREHVLREAGIWIAGGFGPLRGQIIRIGHRGEGARPGPVLATVAALEAALRAQRAAVQPGTAASAARTELERAPSTGVFGYARP